MKDNIVKLRQGLETAFVDGTVQSNLAYKPQFLYNDHTEGIKVLSCIEEELVRCQHFCISVAFITESGITPLLQTLKELEQKGIPGRILTTDYLNFSQPKAIKKLQSLENLDVRMYMTEGGQGFHTKGYMFERDGMYRIIVGSSNMTASALTTNKEWNTKIVSTSQGEYSTQIMGEFENLWDSPQTKTLDQCLEEYEKRYTEQQIIQKQKAVAAASAVPKLEDYKLKPNTMQISFIQNLQKIIDAGQEKALLVSATGDIVILSPRCESLVSQ